MISLSGFSRFISASLLHSFYSLENTTLSWAYFPPSFTSFLYFSLKFAPVSPVSLSCCVLLGNNDRALCILRCKRNRTFDTTMIWETVKNVLLHRSPLCFCVTSLYASGRYSTVHISKRIYYWVSLSVLNQLMWCLWLIHGPTPNFLLFLLWQG